MTDERPVPTPLPEALADLPPSAELVYRLVQDLDRPAHADLVAASQRQPRTVRYGLERLLDVGLVTKRPSPTDARQVIYEPAERRDDS